MHRLKIYILLCLLLPAYSLAAQPSNAVVDACMEKIEQLMNEKKLYTNSELTLDTLVMEMGIDRRHVSHHRQRCL